MNTMSDDRRAAPRRRVEGHPGGNSNMPRPSRSRLALSLALALAFAGSAGAADDPAAVQQRLKEAFAQGTAEEIRVDALTAAAGVADEKVVELVADALRDRNLAVRRAAIDALAVTDSPRALKALQDLYRRDEKLRKDEDTFVALLRAIGRKGDPSSVAVLTDDVFDHITLRTARARINGLGLIRTDDSLEAVFKLTTLAGGGGRRGRSDRGNSGTGVDPDFRLTIAVLTGQDLGPARADGASWWQDNKRKFKVAKERPDLPAQFVTQWEKYWGEKWYADRPPPPPPRIGPPFIVVPDASAEDVDLGVAAIRTAFASGGTPLERIDAIMTGAGLGHPEIVAAIAKGLTDKDDAVRLAAIDALGWMSNPEALKQLHRLYHRDEELREDEVLFARLLQAIGRHGSSSSVEVLKDDPFDHLTMASGKARILGLARIRDTKSVEGLIKGMQLGGGDPRGGRSGSPRFMDDFRLALVVLTGQDLGTSKEAWISWWRDAGKDFRVAAARPALPAELEAAWVAYWNED
jgi:HEAT repeat protein